MTTYRARGGRTRMVIVASVVVLVVLGAGIGALVTRVDNHNKGSSSTSTSRAEDNTTPASSSSLVVASMTPENGSSDVNANTSISVTFSSPLAKASPLPSITPTTPGSWQRSGSTITFAASSEFLPLSAVTLTIPGGSTGILGADGARLSQSITEQFSIENGSIVRLQQLLSILQYSPLEWTPSSVPIASSNLASQTAALYAPPAGSYVWRNRGWPARLIAMWKPGVDNVFTRGLIMSFQADHGLAPNGQIAAALWADAIDAVASNTDNTGGYNYAIANKIAPEKLTIYHDGAVVLTSPANTGIADSPTPDGTFPVYTRLRQQVMHGTNPDGQFYADLVQYIAYFHGNDAVHYMDRADYGIPQSLGCVELPLTDAARAWTYLAYGTLVSVIG